MANLTFINNMRVGGDVQGTYGNTYISDQTITAKKLTGLTVSTGGTLSEEDSLLSAISKLAANIINAGTGSGGSSVPGVDGKTIRNGIGVPSSSLGVDGDFFINKSNWTIYGPKTSGSWGAATSIIGPVGATGSAGPIGATGAAGAAGLNGTNGINGSDGKTIRNGFGAPTSGLGVDGDFYINKSDYTIYGPKTSGAWGSATSLIGPAGPAGSGGTGGGTTVASGITVTPIGNLSSNNAQSAFQELQSDIDTINAALPGKASNQALTDGLATKASTTDLTSGLATKADATATTNALNLKANTTDMDAALALKADTTTMNSALALKASSQALTDGLATKADATATTNSLNLKANTTDVNTALALKADTSVMNSALANKASNQALSDGLATKADATSTTNALADKASNQSLTDGLALKADKTALDSLSTTVGTKANASDVSASLALKADTTTVNSALAGKASNQALSDGLALKANQSALDTLATTVGTKANNSDVSSALALKADASDLNALSNVVSGKADASATTAALAGKASTTALDTLTTVVGTKAGQTALDALSTIVETKANSIDVNSALAAKITSPDTTGQSGKFLAFTGNGYGFLTPGLTLNRVETGAADYNYNPADPAPNIIEVSDMSASRNVNLPSCDSVPDGWSLDVNDATGQCGTNKINIQPYDPNSESVAGGSALQLGSAGAGISMYNNRPKKTWKIRSSFGGYEFVPIAFIPTANGSVTLQCYLDAGAVNVSHMSLSGTLVDTWVDLSGNGNHFVAPYSAAGWDHNLSPNYDGSAFSGHGGLKFIGGGNQFLESNKAFSFLDLSNYTAIMVLRRPNNYCFLMLNDKTNAKTMVGASSYNRMGLKDTIHSAYGLPKNRDVVYAVSVHNGTMTYYMDGIKCDGNLMGVPFSGTCGILQMGGAFGPGNPGVAQDMTIGGLLLYNGQLTDSQHQSIYAYYANRFGLSTVKSSLNVLCEGDSIMEGSHSTFTHMFDEAMIALGYTSFDYVNWAVSGSTIPDITTRAANNIDAHYDYTKPASKNILAIFCGTNDLAYNANQTGTTLYNNMKSYCQSRKALKSWKIAVSTIIPRKEPTAISNDFETKRLDFNNQLRTKAVAEGWCDIVVDIGGDPNLGDNANCGNNTTYFYDSIHPTDAGHQVAAGYWQTAVNTLLNS